MTAPAGQEGTLRQPLREIGRQLSALWWVPLVAGVLSIGLGLAVLAADWTVQALVVVVGLFFVVRGLATVFSPAYAAGSAGEHVVAGVAGIVAGIVLAAWPGPSLLVLAFFVGAWLAVSGAFHVVMSVAHRDEERHWVLTAALGAVELLLGIWAMRRPEVTLSLITALVGLWAVVTGVLYCALAVEVRRDARVLLRELPAGPATPAEVSDRLERLARLRSDGLLSPEEFDQLKDGLLAAQVPAQRPAAGAPAARPDLPATPGPG